MLHLPVTWVRPGGGGGPWSAPGSTTAGVPLDGLNVVAAGWSAPPPQPATRSSKKLKFDNMKLIFVEFVKVSYDSLRRKLSGVQFLHT